MSNPSGASVWPQPFDLSFVHGEITTDGRTLECLTVRAVVLRGDELLEVGVLLGENREYHAARELGLDAYCICSLYYLCRIGEQLVAP